MPDRSVTSAANSHPTSPADCTKLAAAISVVLMTGAVGCMVPHQSALPTSVTAKNHGAERSQSAEAPGKVSPIGGPNVKNEGEPLEMPAYAVQESAFTDFGMSVKTNMEVKWGGYVAWMQVSGVVLESSAAKQGLRPTDRILAIDDRLIAKFNRDAMLEVLFQRKTGDKVKLLVLGAKQALPRFVTLTAELPSLPK
jgi:hypothetical protein